jgi:hypothetical protein
METGYKMFKADVLKQVSLKENRFGFEPEVTAKVSRIKNIRFYEVGIAYYGRTYNDGKKIKWTDGFYAIWCVLKYNIFTQMISHNKDPVGLHTLEVIAKADSLTGGCIVSSNKI